MWHCILFKNRKKFIQHNNFVYFSNEKCLEYVVNLWNFSMKKCCNCGANLSAMVLIFSYVATNAKAPFLFLMMYIDINDVNDR